MIPCLFFSQHLDIGATLPQDTPDQNEFWFLPLGGCGEIGMNMNLYGHDGQWLMVDCGVCFDNKIRAAEDRVFCADPQFIGSRRQRLSGLVITHAHQDHIGAVAALWPQLRCPIYTTPFTAVLLHAKLREHKLDGKVTVHEVSCNATLSIGPFSVTWFLLTHSIPEPCALMIETPLGRVFHTADWKLDPSPVLGPPFNKGAYKRLGNLGIDAIVCDSTNATKVGRSISEHSVYLGLKKTIAGQEGRIIVTCFGSNVARMVSVIRSAQACGRYVGILGRSMELMIRAAKLSGHWPDDLKLSDPGHLGYLPKNEVLILTTGSQGEPRATLSRLAANTHRSLELDAGDTVIFSSMTIPGNEEPVSNLIKQLQTRGVQVIQAQTSNTCLHASGHPCQDELADVYQWTKPKLAIPVHGEETHMRANAKVAYANGVEKALTGENGDLFVIKPSPGIRRRFTKPGQVNLLDH